jgi:hypothetical protein
MTSLLALAAAAGLASLAGCGDRAAGTAAMQGGSIARSGAASPGAHGGRAVSRGRAVTSVALRSRGSSASVSGADSPSGVTGGALFGGNYPVVPLETSLGRQLAIVRLYYFIGDSFPGPAKYQNLMAKGSTLLVSLDSKDTSYASIAAGNEDTAITTFLKAVNQAAIKYKLGSIYVTFEHEPDNESHRSLGSPVQFVQAWDHVHQLAESAHLDWNDGGRLRWVLILIHDTYSSWRMGEFWPGNGEVDLLAADGYNSFGCGSGGQKQEQTPADTFGPLLSFAASHGDLPVFLAEWGSADIPSGEQATYINQMQSYVAANSEIAGALYWDTHVGNCDYKVDGNTASISALATMGQSGALQGQV